MPAVAGRVLYADAPDPVAASWARNSLRRLVALRLVEKQQRGRYRAVP